MERLTQRVGGRFGGQEAAVQHNGRPHPSGCTLFFPFRGPVIGANHTEILYYATSEGGRLW